MNLNLTLIGQAIAFTIFVLVCMRFIWPPMIAALNERRQRIAEGLDAEARARAELASVREEVARELVKAKEQCAELIAQAEKRAGQILEESKERGRKEAERLVAGGRAQLEQETNRAREALRGEVAGLALQGAEKILRADLDPEQHREQHKKLLDKLAAEL